MVENRMDETTLGGIDARGGHRGRRLARIDSTVNVLMTVVIDMAIEQSTRVLPTAAVDRRTRERRDKLRAMIHVDAVDVVCRQVGERGLARHPQLQPDRGRQFGSRMRGLWWPVEALG